MSFSIALVPVIHRKVVTVAGKLRPESAGLKSQQLVMLAKQKPFTNTASSSLKDYFEQSRVLMKSDGGGGPPRWLSPLDCGCRLENSPLLLYLPGFDGNGLGLILHHQTLGEIFDVWCLHIPRMDRTPVSGLVKIVEKTVRLEHERLPRRPIYIVGESLGGCLALSVAALFPDIDLALILINPATCFEKSWLFSLMPLLQIIPRQLPVSLPILTSLITDICSRMAVKDLPKNFTTFLSSISVGDDLNLETLVWKLKILESASAHANTRLCSVKAQSLILTSAKDEFQESQKEGERLRSILPNCDTRTFDVSHHSILLGDNYDLVTIIKGASYYRRGRYHNYVSDYIPPSPSEFKQIIESYKWLNLATSPVMLTTLENGDIVRSLDGIPSEGPVLYVGYHMLLALELGPLVTRIYEEKNIVVRGIAHPLLFKNLAQGNLMVPDVSFFDPYRIMGAVPVSPKNLFRLFSLNSHVLLYPGGIREALHRKGEEYKLFWPKQSEFVRMAARFGAKIVPFGVVGEDDIGELVLDYEDQMKIPFLKDFINEIASESVDLRVGSEGEVANQPIHIPIVLPKLPGRFYYYFGKPIETAGRRDELKSRENAEELYMEVKKEVEKCLCYLKEKRQKDPYRNILTRFAYKASHGLQSQVPTFQL